LAVLGIGLDARGARAQSGLADIRAWVAYMGAAWCGEAAEADAALAHSSQAARYLLTGKDDCVRKATKARGRRPAPAVASPGGRTAGACAAPRQCLAVL